ncbi:uncharacterized protein LOC131040742 [Cryptomeria japonica]|uniref:uncharacterized protein LOC131040742 n=1 Tax=Cryptomeria japonica TaxID=3369 RepID=UPI0027D9CFE9|nr:uncharacterized protein LOC131040742 [Cryptomeria japonica]
MAKSWRVTVLTQAALCLSVFMLMIAFKFLRPATTHSNLDLYFISVGDAERPLLERRALAKQIKATALEYDVQFVVSISDADTNHGLLESVHEAFHSYPPLQVPWHSIVGAHHQEDKIRYFRKQIPIPLHHTMDIIGIDTIELQDFCKNSSLEKRGQDQVTWLMKTLADTTSDWRIVIGWHPLNKCQVERFVRDPKQQLHNMLLPMFMKYGVHVYLHGQEQFSLHMKDKGIACIGNPIHNLVNDNHVLQNGTYSWAKNAPSGFILYRVCALEMEMYFIDWKGTILHRATVHQNGRAVL